MEKFIIYFNTVLIFALFILGIVNVLEMISYNCFIILYVLIMLEFSTANLFYFLYLKFREIGNFTYN